MPAIRTVGYERTSIGEFVDGMRKFGVKRVLDIRELPLSRKEGFSKRALRQQLEAVGIDYMHLKHLGDPKPGRDAARSGQIAEFKRIFYAHMHTEAAKQALALAAELASELPSVLLCYERSFSCCHRAIVAEALKSVYGFRIQHIDILNEEISG